jgi:hypothetical protein
MAAPVFALLRRVKRQQSSGPGAREMVRIRSRLQSVRLLKEARARETWTRWDRAVVRTRINRPLQRATGVAEVHGPQPNPVINGDLPLPLCFLMRADGWLPAVRAFCFGRASK